MTFEALLTDRISDFNILRLENVRLHQHGFNFRLQVETKLAIYKYIRIPSEIWNYIFEFKFYNSFTDSYLIRIRNSKVLHVKQRENTFSKVFLLIYPVFIKIRKYYHALFLF
jgi:hypothetical protein